MGFFVVGGVWVFFLVAGVFFLLGGGFFLVGGGWGGGVGYGPFTHSPSVIP